MIICQIGKKRTKINYSYGDWLEIVFGVSRWLILGPLLFNIYLADLFLVLDDIDKKANYADNKESHWL